MKGKILGALGGIATTAGVAISNLGTAMHEYAHVLSTKLLYSGVRCQVEINSFIDKARICFL